ncbi:MAG TPA: type II toxin-antitoxin system RelE/ParE family toxin [Thermoanaerobaculia bacterium]|nr:type II toxin-antitoxin system RelE/ParE family toxin [Thermoanaerobaculia bacterium]
MKLVYSPESLADLVRLREFIAEKNPAAAQRISGELLNRIEYLKQFPWLGTEVRQAPDPKAIRDFVVDRYVVRYLVAEKTIFILRVWHHREDRPGR